MTSPYYSSTISTFPASSGIANADPLLIRGYKWGGAGAGTSAAVSFSFPNYGATWIGDYYDSEPFQSFTPFTAAQKSAARQALALWAEVANISFTEIPTETSTNVGDIRFGNSGAVTNSTAAAWAYFPYDPGVQYPEAGDVWFDVYYSPNLQLQPGQFGFATLIHEVGHAIGLDHPFADAPGELALPANLDTDQYTVMSYTAAPDTLAYASTPQLLDILAIQYIYGANMTTRTGNDTYKFSAATQTNQTIWDAGGNDTLDFSNQTSAVIVNLAEGSYSRFVMQGGTSSLLGIAYGVTIENAIGGSFTNDMYGNNVANRLTGGNVDDILRGAGGDDRLDGRGGNDTLMGGTGDDIYVIDSAFDTINEEGNTDTGDLVLASVSVNLTSLAGGVIEHAWLTGTAALNATGTTANNRLNGNDGANFLDGLAGADYLAGAKGNDTYVVDNAGDMVVEYADAGIDTIQSAASLSLASFANVENLTLTGVGNTDATGNAAANILTGNDGANRLDGDAGNDTLIGGKGGDTYVVDSTGDVVSETVANASGGGVDTVESSVTFSLAALANVEHLTLTGGASANGTGNALVNTILGNSGNNVLDGGAGADLLKGGAGNDTYILDDVGDTVDEEGNTDLGDTVKTNALITSAYVGIENYTYTGAAAWTFTGDGLGNTLTAGSGNDVLDGANGNDMLVGNGGNDTLIGGAGADWLTGGGGNDQLRGGSGDDIYVIDAGDTVDEQGNSDTGDLVLTSVTVNLTSFAGGAIEHAWLSGGAALNATGNAVGNRLNGNDAANVLDGLAGADYLAGAKGNDTYVVDNAGDTVVEYADGGIDTVLSSVSYILGANVENLTLTGVGNTDATGNAAANILTGNDGANRLDGDAGNDTLIGGKGGDTYVVDSTGDVVSETVSNAAGGGVDTVESSVTFSLAALANVEHLTLTGGAAINGTGNALVNTILGNSGNNVLDGGAGADLLKGGAGNDTYILDDVGDTVDEEGNTDLGDTVKTNALITSAYVGIENYTYTGAAAWTFTGDGLGNTLTAGSGNDVLDGANGNDMLVGNSGNDTLIGGAGADWLTGGGGNDKLRGGSGDDIYVIDANDTVDEEGNSDTGDLVLASATVNLTTLAGGAIEHAWLSGGAALNATGNAAGNRLNGNDAANVLDGLAGADYLAGAKGNDTYVVDDAGDTIVEYADGGIDTVLSSVSYTLGANVENLTLTGSGNTDATGNASANILTGNDGANRLDGDAGNDTLIGGKGGDTYVVDSTGDVVSETVSNAAGGGVDTVESAVTFSLAALANVENLTLTGGAAINGTGNALANTILGNNAANTLDGAAGADILKGGAGDDIYILDNVGDTVDEEGNTDLNDTVKTSALIAAGFAGVERYVYSGAGAWVFAANGLDNNITSGSGNDVLDGAGGNDTLAGNGGNDTLIGGSGADWLTGGGGNDKLRGGSGDDIYVIDANDTVDEEGNADTGDLVLTSVTVNLTTLAGGAIEHAWLSGGAALNATGNSLGNRLNGNDAANVLDGLAGADYLAGAKGNDTYVVDDAGDVVVEYADGGIDTVLSSISYILADNVENLTLTGAGNIDATGNSLVNVLTGNDGHNVLDGAGGADTLIGGKGNDTYVITGFEDVVSETISNAAGGGIDTVTIGLTFSLVGLANVDNLKLTGASAIDGTGNALANTIWGNGAANLLDGGAGADTLKGGAGNDVYILDNAGDTVDEEGNADLDDIVKTSAPIAAAFAGVEDYVYSGAAAWTFAANGLDNDITGGSGNDTLDGAGGNDKLLGNNGDDTLIGGSGADWLEGGVGNDKLRGGSGNDIYVIDGAGDTIDEEGNTDTADVVRATVSVNLSAIAGIEQVILLGASAIDATGTNQDNTLTGNDAANVLDGAGGVDILIGGKGNDTYVIDSLSDQVIETADGGVDTVRANFSLSIASFSNIENLTLFGSGNINATGDTGANVLTGSDGNNILDGGGGNDTLIGGKGDDTYVVDNSKVTIVESISNGLGGGVDTVISKDDFSIENMANIDNLIITGDKFPRVTATGNSSANVLTYAGTGGSDLNGRGGDDRLIGGDDLDFLAGGEGNDYLLGGGWHDSITADAGSDTIDYNHLSELGDTIYQFTTGAGGDILDLHDLLVDIGYAGVDPFGDGYLSYSYTPNAWSQLYVDADGKGSGSVAVEVALLFFTDLGQATADNYIL